MEKIVLCDTNILIDFYRKRSGVMTELERIGQFNIAISSVTLGELLFGARNKSESDQIMRDAGSILVIHVDNRISQGAIDLMRTFSLSHKLSLPDALIASTALIHQIPVYTLNIKDFRFVPGLKIWGK